MTATKTETVVLDAAQTAALDAFVQAQTALIQSTDDHDGSWAQSAISCHDVWTSGVTLHEIKRQNVAANQAGKAFRGGRYLYTSPEQITVHALTGALLAQGDEEDDVLYIPVKVQTIVNRVKRLVGVDVVRAIVTGAESVQTGVEALQDAEAEFKAAQPVTESTESGDDSETSETSTESGAQTLETLLSRALAMIVDGQPVTDSASALIGQLADSAIAALAAA